MVALPDAFMRAARSAAVSRQMKTVAISQSTIARTPPMNTPVTVPPIVNPQKYPTTIPMVAVPKAAIKVRRRRAEFQSIPERQSRHQ